MHTAQVREMSTVCRALSLHTHKHLSPGIFSDILTPTRSRGLLNQARHLGKQTDEKSICTARNSSKPDVKSTHRQGQTSSNLTHCDVSSQVVDRPTQGHKFLSREYVQPQWVLDSANFRVMADARLYAPGLPPPPHLSPFVSPAEDDYVPDYARSLAQLQVWYCSPDLGWGGVG